ncbi:MAG: YIP1 family protein [Firmicutes bacterium]|nr:YIP1 family protein [Bacillota bacterium]
MNRFIDRLYGVLFTPVATLREVAREAPVLQAIGIYILVSLIGVIFQPAPVLSSDLPAPMKEFLTRIGPFWQQLTLLGALLVGPFLFLVMVAAWHLSAELMGGQGKAKAILSTLAFARLPGILIAPFGLIAQATQLNPLPTAGALLGIWVIILQVVGIRESYGLSTGKAILVYLLPYIVLGLVIGLMISLGAVFLGPILGDLIQ